MFNVEVKLRKEFMQFNDRQTDKEIEMQGIRIILGPKVEKFVVMENLTLGNKSNLELLGYTNPNLVQWYMNSAAGAEITLRELEPEHANLSELGYRSDSEAKKINVL